MRFAQPVFLSLAVGRRLAEYSAHLKSEAEIKGEEAEPFTYSDAEEEVVANSLEKMFSS